jgi:carbamoyltransferase
MLVKELKKAGAEKAISERLLFTEHHYSHAASAFFPSPFEEAVVLTIDGVGEWATSTVAVGRGNELKIKKELHFPHSLGLLYSAFTYYTGFKVNSGEYKVMGLAPYGEPRFKNLILDNIVDLKPDGTFRLDQSYFNYCTGLTMTNGRFSDLFGQPARKPESELLTDFHMDVAASIQAVTDEIILRLSRTLAGEYGLPNLCLAGGVALNCVANGRISRDGAFRNIWIQPAAGDAGGAVGAALAVWHTELRNPRVAGRDCMNGSYLGPSFADGEIATRLSAAGARFDTLLDDAVFTRTADALAAGKAVGWFQGRMEFGPRALGSRSILGDPRSPTMQKTLNLKVKFRESFRPFAPSVLREDVSERFDLDCDSPYMLLVADVRADRRRTMTAADVRDREAQCRALRNPGGHSRGLLGPYSDGRSGDQPALPCSPACVQSAHRMRGAHQYLLQRTWRADRVHARGRVSLLHGHRYRCPGLRQCLAREIGAGFLAHRKLQRQVRA